MRAYSLPLAFISYFLLIIQLGSIEFMLFLVAVIFKGKYVCNLTRKSEKEKRTRSWLSENYML